jgi:Undecaprenyl-phosphate glucose phosphotransferase
MKTQEVHLPPVRAEKSPVLNDHKSTFISHQRSSEYHLVLAVVVDLFLLNAVLLATIWYQLPNHQVSGQYWDVILPILLISNILGISIGVFSDAYDVLDGVKVKLNIKNLVYSVVLFFGILGLIYYQFFYASLGIHFLLPALMLFVAFSFFFHMAIRYWNRSHTSSLSYAVVGGRPSNLRNLGRILTSIYGRNAFCLGRFGEGDIPGVNKLGSFRDIRKYLSENNNIDKLLYLDSTLSTHEVRKIGQICRSQFVDFEVIPREVDFFEKGTQVEQLFYLPILRRKREPLCQLRNKIFKRAFDIVFSLFVIVLVFPWLFPLIALLIRLESKGPIFFTQYRTGYWNSPFKCYKFRTMRLNDVADSKQAVRNDERITRVGAFLRKTNLDEMPQFFNVLRGEMSVVGPRPHMLQHTKDYSRLIDKFMFRHEVKPGITGWAQVSGWRGPTETIQQMAKRVEYDVNYIENWSFWFDCKIIFLTVFNVFKGEKNAF